MDIFVSSVAILGFLPLMAIIAVVVAATSRGPVLFRQDRLGRDGHPFRLLKFRTMSDHKTPGGPLVTQSGDSRVTPAGRWLRRCKLDELPQLLNVLHGDMSLVGPRPDVKEFLRGLSPEHQVLLSLTPGLTGWATLHFRNEESLLAGVDPADLSSFYVSHVLPKKAELDLEYAARATFRSDVRLLARTILAVFGSR